MNSPLDLTVSDLVDGLASRRLTSLEITTESLARLDSAGRELNAVVRLLDDTALAAARAADARRDAGTPLSPLDGIPIGIKDLIDVAGVPTAAGSGFPVDGVAGEPPLTPTHDAFVVARLRDAGLIPVAKLHCHEWALGVTSVNPHFGACRNPRDPERIPGGSSGGSAAAVAAFLVPAALGTDTGGSIRIPAALCGVCGLKPTHGRLSLEGIVPLSWTLDHVGPIARTCTDLALLLAALEGHVPAGTSHAADEAEPPTPIANLRVGVPRDELWRDLAPEVGAACEGALAVLASAGARAVEVAAIDWAAIRRAAGTILLSDAAAFHADRLATAPDRFGSDVRRRLETGAALSGPEVATAHHELQGWRQRVTALFDSVDVLVTPTARLQAIRIDQAEGVSAAADYTRVTAPFNLLGLPALSVPAVAVGQELPVGLQIVAPWGCDHLVLEVGAALQALGVSTQ